MMAESLAHLSFGTAEIVPEDGLAEKLALGRPLRVKLGLDPTAADVTLGWAVVLRKLRDFQDAGHTAVLIVGDFTARVGDPSGKSEIRPRLEKDVVRAYGDKLLKQFYKIVSQDRLEVRYNSEWLEPMGMEEILRLTASTTVAQMLERDDFAIRYEGGRPISIMEFMYPLLQGYDSVAVRADVELGGTDQKFNLLVGRDLQREWGQEPQVAVTVPLLEGTDGVQKMSQSLGNYIGIEEPAKEMFGKLMRIPDHLIPKYLLLCTDVDALEVGRIEAGLSDGSLHPAEEKRRLAREVVDLYHGPGTGEATESRFDLVHRDRAVPSDLEERAIPTTAVRDGRVWLPRLLVAYGFAGSNADARRLIEQGGVKIEGKPVEEPDAELGAEELRGRVLQVSRRKFVKMT